MYCNFIDHFVEVSDHHRTVHIAGARQQPRRFGLLRSKDLGPAIGLASLNDALNHTFHHPRVGGRSQMHLIGFQQP